MEIVFQKSVSTNVVVNFPFSCKDKDIYTGATSASNKAHSEQQCYVEMCYFIHLLQLVPQDNIVHVVELHNSVSQE